MLKPLVVITRPSESKIRKCHFKYISGLSLPYKPTQTPKTSHIRTIKKTKRCFHSKLNYEIRSTIILSLIKLLGSSVTDAHPKCITRYIRDIKGMQYYQFDTRAFYNWKNLLYITKTLKVLTIYTNPLRSPHHKPKSAKKSELESLRMFQTKTNLLNRCMNRFTNLEHISFFMRLDEEHHILLTLFEKSLHYFDKLKDIDLTIISFIGKLSITSQNFPNIFSHVKLLKLYAQENVQQLDEIFTSFYLLGKLSNLSITIDNCLKGNWTMFRCIGKLKNLQKIELRLNHPSWEVCCALLEHISLPESLLSFTFGLSSSNPNLSQQLFEDTNWEDYSIFECPRRFRRFITAIQSCRQLQELRIEFDKTKFVKDYNNLFINMCEKLSSLKQLAILIREPEDSEPEEFNQEGTFRFDLVIQSNPQLLSFVKSFELTVPTFSLRNLPEHLEMNELSYLKLSGKLFENTDSNKLVRLLSNIQPKEDFKIVLSEEEVDDEEALRNILESIINIPRLRSFVYMFETMLDKTIIMAILKEFVWAETAALIKFTTMSDVSYAYNKKFKEFLRKNGKEGAIQNHQDGVIVRWRPIDAK